MSGQRALILLAHGSRDPRWRRPFEQLAERLADGAAGPVGLAYLQFCAPDLADALTTARDQGAHEALVIPAFMSGGGHVVRDIPGEVAKAAAAVEGLEVTCASALAEEEEVVAGMVEASLRLAKET